MPLHSAVSCNRNTIEYLCGQTAFHKLLFDLSGDIKLSAVYVLWMACLIKLRALDDIV